MSLEKLAIIIHDPSYDRVSYALSIASVSAAQFKEVHVLFTYGAIQRLVKGKVDEVGEETDIWIRTKILPAIENRHMQKISEMISYLKGFGGRIYACSAATVFHNIKDEDFIEEVDEKIGISTFLERTTNANMIYI